MLDTLNTGEINGWFCSPWIRVKNKLWEKQGNNNIWYEKNWKTDYGFLLKASPGTIVGGDLFSSDALIKKHLAGKRKYVP